MTEQIKVRFLGCNYQPNPLCTRDCTPGGVYDAVRLEEGSETVTGGYVNVKDGIKILSDDAGDCIYTALQWGWEVVEDNV